MHHATPEAAARGDIPERFAPALAVAFSPDERLALVLLDTDGGYQVVCEREETGWVDRIGGNGAGWSSTSEGDTGVMTLWGEAPPGARAAIVRFLGADHEAPVSNGHFLFAAWDVPVAASTEFPTVVRFV